ncbi:MAG: hypothetical protein ACRYFK_14640 [Janthinobacterium lividum]
MRRSTTPPSFSSVGVLSVAVVVLSVYVLLALFISTVFRLPPETERLLGLADNAICIFSWSSLAFVSTRRRASGTFCTGAGST